MTNMNEMWKDAQQFFSSKKNKDNMRAGISQYLQQQYDETTMKVCQDCGKPYAIRDEKEYIDSNGTGYGKVKCCNQCYQTFIDNQREIQQSVVPFATVATTAYIGSSAGFAVIPQRDIWPQVEPVKQKKQKKQKLKDVVVVKKQPKRRILL